MPQTLASRRLIGWRVVRSPNPRPEAPTRSSEPPTDSSPDRLRVLYVVNGFPWPLTSGYLRHYHLIRELARRGHRISLLAIVSTDFSADDRAALEPYADRILTFRSDRRSGSLRQKMIRRFGVVSGGEPAARRLRDAASALLQDVPHDVVIFSGVRTFPAYGALAGLPVVADVCDASSTRVRGSLPFRGIARLPLLLAEYVETRRVERALLRWSTHLLFASVRDRDALIPAGGPGRDRATVVPNGVDLSFWRRPDGSVLGQGEIVFTGAMDYPPNNDAALYLIEDILPRVRRQVPGVHVSIVGRDPTRRLIAAGRRPGVTVTGSVPDVRPYLTAASAFAAPLRFGAGIQNKLLEALAMEVPIVASPNAAAGLVTVDGERPPLVVAGDPETFAAALVERLRAAATDPTPPPGGRDFVGRNFSWTHSADQLDRIVRHAAAVRVGPSVVGGPNRIGAHRAQDSSSRRGE